MTDDCHMYWTGAEKRVELATTRDIVVVDIDGCMFHSPPEAIKNDIYDPDFWNHYWREWRSTHMANQPFVNIIKSLMESYYIIFLTARSSSYHEVTRDALYSLCGVECLAGYGYDQNIIITSQTTAPLLVTRPMPYSKLAANSSGQWKAAVIEYWIEYGLGIRMMFEDHKKSADAIREVVPVMLFESLRK